MHLICAFCEEPINNFNQSYTWMMVNGVAEPVHVSDRWSVDACDYKLRQRQRGEQCEPPVTSPV